MLLNPRIGSRAQVWYGLLGRWLPLHGQVGIVRIVSKGRRKNGVRLNGPRNHGIEIDGKTYVVPNGNLRTPPAEVVT